MTDPRFEDRSADGKWGWDIAIKLVAIVLGVFALWAYHRDLDRSALSSGPDATTGQRGPPPRTVPAPLGTAILLL